ncbi:hypothetical protein [Streptomyces sp. NPDC059994]|uniref:hypothetical protein n=1 Tax=Streptomyces sp. NPDC059994 TaxID=3347029 RepID=UPI003683E038
MNRNGLTVGARVRVRLSDDPYKGWSAGTYRGSIEYVKSDHVGIWVSLKGHSIANGFLTGAARVDANGVWIEGR